MLDFARNQNVALSSHNIVRPWSLRRVWGAALLLLSASSAALASLWADRKQRRQRAAERAELRQAGFQIWHDLGPSRVAEEVGKPPSYR